MELIKTVIIVEAPNGKRFLVTTLLNDAQYDAMEESGLEMGVYVNALPMTDEEEEYFRKLRDLENSQMN